MYAQICSLLAHQQVSICTAFLNLFLNLCVQQLKENVYQKLLTDLLIDVQFINFFRLKRTSKKKYNINNEGLVINNSMFDDVSLSSSSGVTTIRMAKKEKEAAEDNIYVDSPSRKLLDEPVIFENSGFNHDDSD